MINRTIDNTLNPLTDGSGVPLADIPVDFVLVDANRKPTGVWDVAANNGAGELIAPLAVRVKTDAAGVFPPLALWPNDRGDRVTQWLCRVHSPHVADFIASVPSGASALTWQQFAANGLPLTPAELSAFLAYQTATNARLDALEAGGGGGGIAAYTHTQAMSATTWTINHNLGYRPDVSVTDAGGNERAGSVTHLTVNQTVINFINPLAGTARLI